MTDAEKVALIERLQAHEKRIRRAGDAAAAHHYEDIQKAGESHIRFANDIRDVLALLSDGERT